MTTTHTLLLSDAMAVANDQPMQALAAAAGTSLRLLPLSQADAASLHGVDCAWYSRDLFAGRDGGPTGVSEASRRFFTLVDEVPAMRWLHVMSAGVDLPAYRQSIARGVRITTSAGVVATPIAHSVLAAVLAQARPTAHWQDAQQHRNWSPVRGAAIPRDLGGQTAVIVGLGPIGREIARLLRAFGVRTVGVRRSAAPSDAVDRTLAYADIDEVLPHCDWLILCCPLSPATHRLIDAARLALLPAHAFVANVGRGPVIDEAALTVALHARRIAGAYLDVFEHEPLAEDSELWSLPGVRISPHNSAAARGNAERDQALFLENLGRWLRGQPLVNEAQFGGG